MPVRKWSCEDIACALAFKAVSPNGYKYVREQLNLPFPSVSSLQRWTAGYIFDEGLQPICLDIMKARRTTMTEGERACIVSFDEMKVSECWEFRRSTETVMAPHRYVQVAMVRGIIGCWKQVVYYNFDTKMTKDILKKIIIAVEGIGYEVHATVCDMGGSNVSLLKTLGINENQNTFPNPFDESSGIMVHHYVKGIKPYRMFCSFASPLIFPRKWPPTMSDAGFTLEKSNST